MSTGKMYRSIISLLVAVEAASGMGGKRTHRLRIDVHTDYLPLINRRAAIFPKSIVE